MATKRPQRFTEKAITAIEPTDKPQLFRDPTLPGFALRVQPSGRKVWVLRYKTPEGNRTTTTIGIFPAFTYSMALEFAKAILRGEDPRPKPEPAPEPEPPALTLRGFLRDYYNTHLDAHSSNPDEAKSRLARLPFQDKPLMEINIGDVEAWRTKRLQAKKARTTINRDVAVLRAALQKAVDWEKIEANPLARLKPLKVDRKPNVRYLSSAEEQRLHAALTARDDRKRAERQRTNEWRHQRSMEPLPAVGAYAGSLTPLVVVALNTGLRRGELWGLTWRDVNLKARRLTVRGSGAKSGQTRHIPLNAAAAAALKTHKGEVSPLPNMPVFARQDLKKVWAGVLKAAKIEKFRFHDCRHHFASKLVMAGVPLNTVRELLGHGDMSMTLRYAHLAPDNLRAAVDLLGGA